MLRLTLCLVCLMSLSGCFSSPEPEPKPTPPVPMASLADILYDDELAPTRRERVYTIEIVKTSGQQPYHWRVRAKNGQILLVSEKYVDNPFRTCENFAKAFQRGMVRIEDLTRTAP